MPEDPPRTAPCPFRDLLAAALSGLLDRLLRLAESLVGSLTTPQPQREVTPPEGHPNGAHKFDLGAAPREPTPEHIPWGYGQDRITAMVVDPDRLFVYWEATDEAIARARAALGAEGAYASLALRVYDVTGRLFDGTNANDYFDQRVERGDRQWFFHVGRPTATVCVELGLQSTEGRFVRIARSGRADFPRRSPAPDGPPQWLTVRAESADVAAAPEARAAERFSSPGQAPDRAPGDAALLREHAAFGALTAEPGMSWEGEVVRTTWEAGPFAFPVSAPTLTVERVEEPGGVEVQNGRGRVVHAVWRIVIRGIGGWAARRVLGVWEIRRAFVRGEGPTLGELAQTEAAGASEQRLGGASELYSMGASEARLGGASERLFRGASERLSAGARYP
jgi:hypothetical protein